MQAPDSIDVEATETRLRGACLVSGCTCKDPRIVSRRHAAYYAAMALRSGETARRVVAAEADWRIPGAPLTMEVTLVLEEPNEDVPTQTVHAATYAPESEAER